MLRNCVLQFVLRASQLFTKHEVSKHEVSKIEDSMGTIVPRSLNAPKSASPLKIEDSKSFRPRSALPPIGAIAPTAI